MTERPTFPFSPLSCLGGSCWGEGGGYSASSVNGSRSSIGKNQRVPVKKECEHWDDDKRKIVLENLSKETRKRCVEKFRLK